MGARAAQETKLPQDFHRLPSLWPSSQRILPRPCLSRPEEKFVWSSIPFVTAQALLLCSLLQCMQGSRHACVQCESTSWQGMRSKSRMALICTRGTLCEVVSGNPCEEATRLSYSRPHTTCLLVLTNNASQTSADPLHADRLRLSAARQVGEHRVLTDDTRTDFFIQQRQQQIRNIRQ